MAKKHELLGLDGEEDVAARRESVARSRVIGAALVMACVAATACVVLVSREGRRPIRGALSSSEGIVELVVIEDPAKDAKQHGANPGKAIPGKSHQGKKAKTCSWGQENCNATRCCNNPGTLCYQQNDYYAQCRESCMPGPIPTHWDGQDWTCKELGERAEGTSKCSSRGEDCSESKCCTEGNTQCFEKGPGWSACKTECYPWAPDLTDADSHYWTCEKLGPMTPSASPWVDAQCSANGEDCRDSKCCKSPGAQCYAQSPDWADCRYECTPGKDPARSWEPAWSCDMIGTRTPGSGPPPPTTVSKWVADECAWDGADCKGSRCCVGMNKQCFAKNDDFAMCKESCQPGRHAEDNNETWTCAALGPRSIGLATKGSPSLWCWSLFQPTSYEMGVIQNQLNRGIGIFDCDGYVTLSTAEPTYVGKAPDGDEVTSLHVDMAEITVSVDGTAGNAALFINCWNVIVEDGRWNNYAWTVKADPDAVLLPPRLRQHLAPHSLEKVFILNCNAYPSSPEFPMMYGSLEIFSWKAVKGYKNDMWLCMRDMSEFIPLWGEDRFMKKCLDRIGVGAIQDFSVIGDGVCSGVDCGSTFVAAFHPFKDVDSWQQCWDTAQR